MVYKKVVFQEGWSFLGGGGGERPMKQALVPRYSGLPREVVSGQGGLSRGGLLY